MTIHPDIVAERQRQIEVEGYGTVHDDEHDAGEIGLAANCYRALAMGEYVETRDDVPVDWPWKKEFWKPRSPRRDLVRAGALYLAERDRLARKGQDDVEIDARLQEISQAIPRIDKHLSGSQLSR